jgi:uncharacterized membrane protein YkoI
MTMNGKDFLARLMCSLLCAAFLLVLSACANSDSGRDGIAASERNRVALSSAGAARAEDDDGEDDDDDDDDDEEEIPLDQVPQNVKDAAVVAVPAIVLEEAERETENDVLVYEVEGEVDGVEYAVEVSADGQVLEVEVDDDGEDEDDDDDKR